MKGQSFDCPACGSEVPSSRELAGKLARCPDCQAEVPVPSVVLPPRGRQLGARRGIQPKLTPAEVPNPLAAAEEEWGDGARDSVARNSRSFEPRFPLLWRWRAVIGIGLVLVVAAGILFPLVEMSSSDGDSQSPVQALVEPVPLPPADQFDPSKTVNRFVDAETTMEERLELLRAPFDEELVRKQLVATADEWESGIEFVDYLGQAQMLDLGYHGYYVHFRNGQERFLCAVEQPDGFRLDWDAYVRPGAETAWMQLLAGAVQTQELRVFLVPGNYYNYAFSNQQEFSSFTLNSPDSDANIFGYARRHSATEDVILQAINEAWSPNGLRPVLLTLRLEAEDQSQENRQFLITHVVATSWVVSTVGTVEDLWVDMSPGQEVSGAAMAEFAGKFDAPLMFQQGLELKQRDTEGAERFFRNALENQESFFPARLALADVLVEQGKLAEAEVELNAILIQEENNVEAHYRLGICAFKRGDMEAGIQFMETTVGLDPNHAVALNNLAWLLATHSDRGLRTQTRVVEMAEHAVMLGLESQPSFQATLAVAYAAVGRYREAVATTEKALSILRTTSSDSELEAKLTTRLELFKDERPYEPN